jgi:UDP-N-acetylmuramate dehydrogenase
MIIQENISLKPYNTFGIDVNAKYFISVSSISELQHVLVNNKEIKKLIIGGGSNILFTEDIEGLVIHLNTKGIKLRSTGDTTVVVSVAAGENWHDFVLWSLKNDFGGVENLSLIPGNVGTAPIQNIGAYGVELKDIFDSCEAIDLATGNIKTFLKSECDFGYRESIFKNKLKNKYIILNVNLRLSIDNHGIKTNYGTISNELQKNNITNPTIQDVSEAIINIRTSKLPDPKLIGNSGSFFKNPVVSKETFKLLKLNFSDIPSYEVSNKLVKIPAGWLIEKAGFKGKRFGSYGVHRKQALVLVNYGGAKGNDIKNLAYLIQDTILKIFRISLELEVNIIETI